ncbi:hypothetical protein [Brevibacillus sp. NRS-1366]|uniref:hypothetical protein n=1 Tax=Brevibacillus sp. NRS-1366 TaxID=3233899 RepID=UPI003D1CD79B
MRVNQTTSTSQTMSTEFPLELKEGEVYAVKIKEPISENGAIIQIRGKDVQVQFEGKIPSGERMTLQITDSQGQVPKVRTVSVDQGSSTGEPDVSTILRSLGSTATPELKQAAKILLDSGIPLSKETLRDVKEFLEKASGNVQQKLEAIQAIANKKLGVSPRQLQSVHAVLHGPTLTNVLSNLEKNSDLSIQKKSVDSMQSITRNMNAIVKSEPSLEKAIQQIRTQLQNNPKIVPEIAAKIEKALIEAQYLQQRGQERVGREHLSQSLTKIEEALSNQLPKETTSQGKETASRPPETSAQIKEALNQAKETVKRESNLEKAIQQIRTQLLNNAKIVPEIAAKIEKALLEAQQLQQYGQDRPARILLLQSLEQVTAELGRISSQGQDTKITKAQVTQPPIQVPNTTNTASTASMGLNVTQSPDELLQNLIKMVQQEPSLERVVQQFQLQFDNQPNADSPAVSKVEKALAQAVSLQQMGWEQVGREQVLKVLDQVGLDLVSASVTNEGSDHISSGQHQYNENMGALLATKDLVVTEITARLSQAASQFKAVKREVARNIDNIIHVAQTNRGNIISGVKPLLESTIDMLDKAILKSDLTMLTDMETEKQIMNASSQLAEARRLLTKGENSQAMTILNEVKSKLESLQWKPSNVRVQHFLTVQSVFSDEMPSVHKVTEQVAQVTQQYQSHEPSARNTFEFFRSLGLNYESEVAQSLSFGQQNENDDLHKNLKAALLQLQIEDTQSSLPANNQQVEKALHNLTGQQLLSKSDTGSNLQNMFFQLPVMLGGSLESAKVYVNSKNEGQKVDWENCSLYFLIETKKMGQTGIHISAVDRNLSITIKNNLPNIKEKVDSLVSKCKDNLKEIGYNISGVSFAKLTEEVKDGKRQQVQAPPQPTRPNTFAKGLDFKI